MRAGRDRVGQSDCGVRCGEALLCLASVTNFLIGQILRFTAASACCRLCRSGHDSGRIWMHSNLTGQYSRLHPYAGVP